MAKATKAEKAAVSEKPAPSEKHQAPVVDKVSSINHIDRFNQASSKIECVREIRKHLMDALHKDPSGKEVYQLFQQTSLAKGDETSDKQFVSSTLSQIRKHERGVSPGLKRESARHQHDSSYTEPSMTELQLVFQKSQDLANGLKELSDYVEIVLPILDRMGGSTEKLRSAIKFLEKLDKR